MVDISTHAGFSLEFEPRELKIESGDNLVFTRTVRFARELTEVLAEPSQVGPDEPLYMMDELGTALERIRKTFDRFALTYSLVLLPPRIIGNEYVKTAGHFHPPISGTTLGYPEVYTQLYGNLILLLQRRSATDSDQMTEFLLVEMNPGFTITIPPNYAHCLVNPTAEPAVMAGLYGKSFKADYEFTRRHHGLAYYVVRGQHGLPEVVPNPNYKERPEATRLTSTSGTHFAPVSVQEPIWSSFLRKPDEYAFLTQATAATRKFANWL